MKVTSQTLAERIVEAIDKMAGDEGCERPSKLSADTLLEHVPELKNFDTLAVAVEEAYQDADQALTGAWDRGDHGFEAMRDSMQTAYKTATGEDPEPYADDLDPDGDGLEDEDTGEDVEEEEGVETAPDESEN